MLIKKVTTGFVIQTYDTEENKYIGQEFVAGQVDFEDVNGEPVDPIKPYLPYEMIQPK